MTGGYFTYSFSITVVCLKFQISLENELGVQQDWKLDPRISLSSLAVKPPMTWVDSQGDRSPNYSVLAP